MSVRATKGLKFLMSGTTTPAALTITGATAAKPSLVTLASTTGMADGQLVTMSGTSLASLDGKTFVVGSLIADTSFVLVGSDASKEAGAAAGGTATFYDDAIDMTNLCLSAIGVNAETSSPISVGTFCDVTATIPGLEAGAGTLDLSFYLDKDSTGYAALLAAEADGNAREFKIEFPQNGYLTMVGIVGSVTFTDIPLDGSAALTAQVTLSSKPVHRF